MKKSEAMVDLEVVTKRELEEDSNLPCVDIFIKNRTPNLRGQLLDIRSDEYAIVDHGHCQAAYKWSEIKEAA